MFIGSKRELLQERFQSDKSRQDFLGSRVSRIVIALTVLNFVFLAVASTKMIHFMDQPRFCGTACHEVMGPEWATYQDSPHARVKCVECHVGEGADALLDSKLNGLWQIISATFDLYERPIPTPVHQLRPARETCEKCHWPEKFYGSKIKTVSRYDQDSLSSPRYTTLNLKIDAGKRGRRSGIHWHVGEENEVRYASVADNRKEMVWVDVKDESGEFKRYTNRSLQGLPFEEAEPRSMDCVDCHNRATHIYEEASRAIDKLIANDLISRDIPFVKKAALAAISSEYVDYETAYSAINNKIMRYYRNNFPKIQLEYSSQLESLVESLFLIYTRNIHPGMNVYWGSYPNHIGHSNNQGCFRCHNSNLIAEDGMHISDDCTLCHSLLAYESDEAFKFFADPDTTDPDYSMHKYLKAEFLQSLKK